MIFTVRKMSLFFAFSFLVLLPRLSSANLIINEIMYDPLAVSDTNGEWFEIYNSGPATDLNGYAVSDATSTVPITSSLIIPQGGFLVFGRNSDTAVNGGVPVDYTVSFSLNNSGDTLSLFDGTGMNIDSVTFGSGTGFPTATGASLYFNGVGDNADGANWGSAAGLGITYGDGDFGTPGQPNIAAVPEPASLLLYGTGLLGLLVKKRKKD
jgi:hypothetical protein